MPDSPRARPAPQPASDFEVVVASNAAELLPFVAAWDDLAANAFEPNVFYESWMLLPALRAYASKCISVALVFSNLAPRRNGQRLLCGLFPLERRRYPFVSVLRLWHYVHCFLATPLVRAGFGRGVLRAFFDWLSHADGGAALLECGRITGDGSFTHHLLEHAEQQPRGLLLIEAHTRALLRQDSSSAIDRLSGDKRKKLRRAEKQLAELGTIAYTKLEAESDLDAWLADFLRLEASGWKRLAGTALICQDLDRQFFVEVVRAAFQRRRLMMLGLTLNGQHIAQLCNFLAGDGSFAFKVAFDQAYERYSPGALLELENLRQTAVRPELRWMDSCTDPGETLVKQLWQNRRIIQTVVVDTGRAPGALLLAVLPLWRWLRRRLQEVLGGNQRPS